MKIGGFQKQSLIDYPGKISSIIFTIGCNFRCPYCHNKKLVVPGKAEKIPEDEVLEYLQENKRFIDAVSITGGEPTLQKDLHEFIKKLKEKGFLVKLDTNGSNPLILKEVLCDLDYVAMDVKAPIEKTKQTKASGTKFDDSLLEKIKESISLIKNSSIPHEFRTTALPRLHSTEDLLKICEFIGEDERLIIQKFRPGETLDESFSGEKTFTKNELEKIKKACEEKVNEVVLRI